MMFNTRSDHDRAMKPARQVKRKDVMLMKNGEIYVV
jgi:hypothetical protein